MATSTSRTKTKTTTPDLAAATEQFREAGDRFVAASRKVTGAYLAGLERYSSGLVKTERKIGEQSRIDAVGQIITAHASLTENVVKASVSKTRELVSA